MTCTEKDFQRYKAKIAAIEAKHEAAANEAAWKAAAIEQSIQKALASINFTKAVSESGDLTKQVRGSNS